MPGPPSMTLALLLPIRVSSKAEPSMLSKRKSRSWPSPRARCSAQRDLDAAALAGADVGREGGDVAAAGAAVHAVVAVVAVDEVEVAGAAVDGVDAEAAGDLVVVAGAAEDVCRRRGRRSPGRRRRRRRRRCRCRGRRGSGRRPGRRRCRSLPRLPRISSSPPPPADHVAARRAAQLVGAVGADDRRPRPWQRGTSSSSARRRPARCPRQDASRDRSTAATASCSHCRCPVRHLRMQ